MPKVSAIITTFNRANFLKKAIESVLSQEYEDFELLVLDNNSSDNTPQIVQSFTDNRIRYIKHPPLNISQARNLGVREARGEFVAFLDDDDEWLPNKLRAQIEVFSQADLDLALVYGGFIWVDESGREINVHRPVLKGKILLDLLAQKDPFSGSASNPMLRKSVIEELGGYNERVSTGEDWELYLRLAEKYKVDFTPEIVVKIRQHSGIRLGDKLQEAVQLEKMVLERWNYIFDKNSKLKSFYLQKIGGKLCRLGKEKEGRRYIIEAIRINPLNLFAYVQFILSFAGQKSYIFLHQIYKSWKRRLFINFIFKII